MFVLQKTEVFVSVACLSCSNTMDAAVGSFTLKLLRFVFSFTAILTNLSFSDSSDSSRGSLASFSSSGKGVSGACVCEDSM